MPRRASLALSLFLVGCFPSGEGVDPPSDRDVYFPVGLALDRDASHLFIVNSDYDLQFNAGTVASWDLEALHALLPKTCRSDDDCTEGTKGTECDLATADKPSHVPSGWCAARDAHGNLNPCLHSRELMEDERQIYPGRCAWLNPRAEPRFHVDSVKIGAFASEAVYRARPGESGNAGRLFIPVRGDATLHWIDTGEYGELSCGQGGNDGACSDDHRRGDDPAAENTRGAAMLPEPFGIDASESGDWLMISNQNSFAVGLFQNLWGAGSGYDNGPSYQYTYGFGQTAQPMGVTAVPRAKATPASADLPEFLVGFRGAAIIELLRVYPDAESSPPRPYLKAPVAQPITTNANGSDSRGMAVDASARRRLEQACADRFGVDTACAEDLGACADAGPAYGECLVQAAAQPLDVLVTNRGPSSLLVGETRNVIASVGTYDIPAFQAAVPLSYAPSRVAVGDVKNADGVLERRAFAISFDSRRVLVYDLERQRVETEIVTGRGPHAIAIDSKRALAYVAHFTDSYIGVVDLDQSHPTYGVMIASVELPIAPRASK